MGLLKFNKSKQKRNSAIIRNYYFPRVLVISFISLLSGCLEYKPLVGEPYNRGIGYSEKKLSVNSWLVRYDGKRENNFSDLRQNLIRRASELCPGSFEISDLTYKSGFALHTFKTVWPYVESKVRCTQDIIDDSKLFEYE